MIYAKCPKAVVRAVGKQLLALGFAMLDPSRTLRENDVQEGDTLELVLST